MGYESVEKDSLITLKTALEGYIKKVAAPESQQWKDANYELNRIRAEIAMYD